MYNFKITVLLDTNRLWSDLDIERLTDDLEAGGINADDIEQYLNDILRNVIMRGDVIIRVKEDFDES